jgi:hypothetical protein
LARLHKINYLSLSFPVTPHASSYSFYCNYIVPPAANLLYFMLEIQPINP